jgi:hypothetical protein
MGPSRRIKRVQASQVFFPQSLHLFSAKTLTIGASSSKTSSSPARAMLSIVTARVVLRDFLPKEFTEHELTKVYDQQNLALVIVFGLIFLFIVIVVISRGCCGCEWQGFGRKSRDDEEGQRDLTRSSPTSTDSIGLYSRDLAPSDSFHASQESGVHRLAPVHLSLGSSFEEARSVSLDTSSDEARTVSDDGPYYEIDLSDYPSRASSPRQNTSGLGRCSVQ